MINKIIKIKSLLIAITIVLIVSCNKEECNYADAGAFPYNCDGGMDVAFAIDYTASMGSAINGIKTSIGSIVSTINTQSGGDYRLSLSIFDEQQKGAVLSPYLSNVNYIGLPTANKIVVTSGSLTDQYLTMMEKFSTANSASFTTQLNKLNGVMSIGNGGSLPEPGDLLTNEIVNNSFAGAWRPGKTKFLIIITDAQSGGDDDKNTTVDDAYLTTLAASANIKQIQIILVSTLTGSNYELKLINPYVNNHKVIATNFNNIATDINTIIQSVCNINKLPVKP